MAEALAAMRHAKGLFSNVFKAPFLFFIKNTFGMSFSFSLKLFSEKKFNLMYKN